MDNPLWQYSIDVYRRAGVEPLLLRLQDECGLDVNVLLYAAWLGAQEIELTPAHRAVVLKTTAEWREGVVAPLRDLRRRLRGIDTAGAVRERLKALELDAEEEAQRLIFACHRSAGLVADGGTVAGNLERAAAHGGAADTGSRPLLQALAALLAS